MRCWFIAYDIKSTLEGATEARKSIEQALEDFERASGSVRVLEDGPNARGKMRAAVKALREQRDFLGRLDIVLGVRRSLDALPEPRKGTTLPDRIVDTVGISDFIREMSEEVDAASAELEHLRGE